MLKSELIRPRIRIHSGTVSPRSLPADYHWLAVSSDLIALFKRHVQQTRGTLDAALRDYEGDSIEYPIIRGLTAVLATHATFDNHPPFHPLICGKSCLSTDQPANQQTNKPTCSTPKPAARLSKKLPLNMN